MKLGLDATPLLGQRSGVGNYTGRLLAAMMKLEPDWSYLLYSKRPLGPLEPALAGVEPIGGHLPQSTWLWMQTVLPMAIARSGPDLVHFTNALAPLVPTRPFVLTIHDASLFVYSEHHPRIRALYRLLLPVLARQASAVVTISQHARGDLLRLLGLPAEKVHVIYEAAPANFRPVTDSATLTALRQKYKLPESFLLYVGTVEPRKNLVRLLQALKRVRRHFDYPLVMVGPTGWLMTHFEREVEKLGLSDIVHYLGYVPEADLPGIYSLATLFVYPSLYEGFGLPPMEAMACGTPVLSSNRASLAEIYTESAHLIDPESVDCLADGIVELLRDPERLRLLSQQGLAWARSFSWERAARETMGVYRTAIDRGRLNGRTG